MTILATEPLRILVEGNDSATDFSFSPMTVFVNTDLKVWHVSALGLETLLTEGTGPNNYIINVTAYPGTGSITYPADLSTPLPTGQSLAMRAVLPINQLQAYRNQGGYFPDSQEIVVDRLTKIAQQQQEELERSFKIPVSSAESVSVELPAPSPFANLAWNALGDGLTNQFATGATLTPSVAGKIFLETLPSWAQYQRLAIHGTLNIPVFVPDVTVKVPTAWDPASTGDAWLTVQDMLTYLGSLGGGTLEFQGGFTYRPSKAWEVPSNVQIIGHGAIIKPHASWVGANLDANCFFFRNVNHGLHDIPAPVSTLTDENIVIDGFHFDYDGVTIAGGGAHCISMRYVKRVVVTNCSCSGDGTDTENLTAMLACQDTAVLYCNALNARNCAFDHWDGFDGAMVAHCTARVGAGLTARQGIQFTGAGSLGESRSSKNGWAIGNYVKGIKHGDGTSSGIIANAVNAGSRVDHVVSSGNLIEDCNIGLSFDGAGDYHVSQGDTIKNVLGVPIFLKTSTNSPNHVRITNPLLIDCDHTLATPGLIAVGGTGHVIKGVKVVNAGASLYENIVWFASAAVDCQAQIDAAPTGLTGRLLNQGTNCRLLGENLSYTPSLAFGGGTTGLTYTSRAGGFTYLDADTIYFWGRIVVLDNGSSTGTATITIPVIAHTAFVVPGLVDVRCAGASGLTSRPSGSIAAGAGVFTLVDHGATGSVVLDETNIPNGCTVDFSGTYKVPRIT